MDETDNICFVCDKTISSEKWKYKLQVTATKKRNVPVADLIKQLVGEEFEVLVGERDAVCSTCMKLLNLMESLTSQLEGVQTTLSTFLQSKYGLATDDTKFQVQYDDSLPEDTEPLLNCDKCNFQTKYEKEFNSHIRSHKSSTISPAPAVVTPKPKVTKPLPTNPVKFSMSTRSTKKALKNTTKTFKDKTVKEEKKINSKSPTLRQNEAPKKQSKPKKQKVVFQCSVCDKIFPNESLIRSHAKKQHGKEKIEVSEDEYEDVQTLEEVELDETAVTTKKQTPVITKKQTPVITKKQTPVITKKQTQIITKKKKQTGKQKKRKISKSGEPKLDFLDDWEEDDENDDFSSPEKKAKIFDDDNTDKQENKIYNGSISRKSSSEHFSDDDEADEDKDTSSKPTCLFCHATFSSFESVQDHIKMSHSDKKSHLNFGSSSANLKNPETNFEVDSTTDIVENNQPSKHIENKHSGVKRTFKCNLCGIKKVSLQFIQQHTRAHKRKLCLQCKLCGISCRNIAALKIHASKCHKAAPIPKKCSYCNFKFFDGVQLKNHVRRVHNKFVKVDSSNIEKNQKQNENSNINHDTPPLGEVRKSHSLVEKECSSEDISKISVSEVSSTSFEDSDKTKYKCKLCDFKGNSDLNLKDHVEKCHEMMYAERNESETLNILHKSPTKTKLKCEECNFTFSRPSRLADHMNRHKVTICQQLGICIYCSKVFLNKDQVSLHINLKHENFSSKPKCHVCSREYSHVKDFRIHFMRCHFDDTTESLMKQMTEQDISGSNNLNNGNNEANDIYSKVFKELQDITGEGNDGEDITVDITQDPMFTYHCPLCEFDSSVTNAVKNHLKTHTQNYCNICQGIFNPEESIKHIENHAIENQNVKCLGCDSKFHDEIHLQFHIHSSHPEKKPHKCSMCVKSYLTEKSMLNHKQSKHGKKTRKMFSCNKCNKKFYAEKLYHTHTEFAHRSSLNCKYCDKLMSDVKKLESHERNHLKQVKSIYKCNVCGKVLKSQIALRTHKINHTNPKQLHCDICNLNFKSFHTLREHSARHSDVQEKKYFCDICGKGFYFYDSHIRHRRIHLDPLLFQCKLCKGRFPTNQKLHEHMATCSPA